MGGNGSDFAIRVRRFDEGDARASLRRNNAARGQKRSARRVRRKRYADVVENARCSSSYTLRFSPRHRPFSVSFPPMRIFEMGSGYNNRPTLQMRVQQKLRSYANISPSRARQIAKECRIGERPGAIRLVRERKRLYYRIVGDEAVANVNALDGELIECKRRNR